MMSILFECLVSPRTGILSVMDILVYRDPVPFKLEVVVQERERYIWPVSKRCDETYNLRRVAFGIPFFFRDSA
jgi:hypothetical protein